MKKTKYLIIYLLLAMLNAVCILTLAENKGASIDFNSASTVDFERLSPNSVSIPEPEDNNLEILSNNVRLYIPEENTVRLMDVDEYLIGVLSGEMYHDAPIEALKAVAVAARTYTLYMASQNIKKGWDVTADSSVCQAYVVEDNGNNYLIKQAIEETRDEVVTYNGDLICAMYHASSLLNTENCENVFLEKLPYLSSVKSFENENNAYFSEKVLSAKDINDILEENNFPVFDGPTLSIKVTLNENGRCKNIILSDDSTGIVISGREAREIFGIRSTGFSVENTDGKFSFKVYGFGHGVGLSQNGAVIMADKGYNYREILTHYYSGTDISKTIYKS